MIASALTPAPAQLWHGMLSVSVNSLKFKVKKPFNDHFSLWDKIEKDPYVPKDGATFISVPGHCWKKRFYLTLKKAKGVLRTAAGTWCTHLFRWSWPCRNPPTCSELAFCAHQLMSHARSDHFCVCLYDRMTSCQCNLILVDESFSQFEQQHPKWEVCYLLLVTLNWSHNPTRCGHPRPTRPT